MPIRSTPRLFDLTTCIHTPEDIIQQNPIVFAGTGGTRTRIKQSRINYQNQSTWHARGHSSSL
jgi:hypothetical protein